MQLRLKIYNTLTRTKEFFVPLHPPSVGMYVCGPTVYGEAHVGHARSAINFDMIFRYLKHLGYQVRYVRNITDVGHLEGDGDEGSDKVARKARLEALEPMEIAQRYTNHYRRDMNLLHVNPPSIEPIASGHIPEQISMIQRIIEAGIGYEINGSVYFDVRTYHAKYGYGRLSGRVLDELLVSTRSLNGQRDKRYPLDFALWKKASIGHLMRWSSPWGIGFPGWHTECAAMASKYLGVPFDIHGGGLDLLFPHHECELAHANVVYNQPLAKYWLHNNLIVVNGQKMGKSLNNFITLTSLFQGAHPQVSQVYSPMALRYYILQAHYRSVLHFSEHALRNAHQGYTKLMNGLKLLHTWQYPPAIHTDLALEKEAELYMRHCDEAMCDDFNTPKVLVALFGLLRLINILFSRNIEAPRLRTSIFLRLKSTYKTFVLDILGLHEPSLTLAVTPLIQVLLEMYQRSRRDKRYEEVNMIRAELKRLGVTVQDTSSGVRWDYL